MERRLQFSLRSSMLAMTCAALALGAWTIASWPTAGPASPLVSAFRCGVVLLSMCAPFLSVRMLFGRDAANKFIAVVLLLVLLAAGIAM